MSSKRGWLPAASHSDLVRKIDSGKIIAKLQRHIDDPDTTPLSATQLRACELLISRTIPVLSSVEVSTGQGVDLASILLEARGRTLQGQATTVPDPVPDPSCALVMANEGGVVGTDGVGECSHNPPNFFSKSVEPNFSKSPNFVIERTNFFIKSEQNVIDVTDDSEDTPI